VVLSTHAPLDNRHRISAFQGAHLRSTSVILQPHK
jgi:hypothetical protein